MNKEVMHQEIRQGLTWGGGVVVVALCATFARKVGFIDVEVVQRLVLGANGLMIVIYTGLFVFAPFSVAAIGGSIAIVVGIALTFSYCLSLRSKATAA